MFEQDYIMRLIKEMVRAVLKLFKEQKEILENLLDMIDAGNINEAENKLYDLISDKDMSSLEMALLFYSYLNDKTDEFLEENNFCREEIKLGMENVAETFGLTSIAKMFLTDF